MEADSIEVSLIDLLPPLPIDDSPDTMTCNIRDIQLSEDPAFEALSFVWGPQESSFPAFCDGHQCNVGIIYSRLCCSLGGSKRCEWFGLMPSGYMHPDIEFRVTT